MKRRTLKQLGVLAAALTLITTSLLGGTLAKYTTTVTASDTATVAKWDFKVNDSINDTFALDLVPTTYTNVASGKIAPGTTGKFEVRATNSSEVAATCDISFTAANAPTNLKFYKSADGIAKGDELTATSGTYTMARESMAQGAAKAVYVMWEWPYEGTPNQTANDADDTVNGKDLKAMTVDVTVTGTQATPAQQQP